MKVNAVLYHTTSFPGARHLISIFFFFVSSLLQICPSLHFLRDTENWSFPNLEKIQTEVNLSRSNLVVTF